MNMRFWMALASIAVLPAFALADDWKDESGKGRGGPPPWAGGPPPWAGQGYGPPPWAGRGGEPPDWARGKGVWDDHLKHDVPPVDGRYDFRSPIWNGYAPYPQYGPHPQYAPPMPYAPGWVGDPEDYRDRLKDMREREREGFRDWQEETRERNQELRDRERKAYTEWREWQREGGPYVSPPLGYPAAPWR